jgi:hypothetical protein
LRLSKAAIGGEKVRGEIAQSEPRPQVRAQFQWKRLRLSLGPVLENSFGVVAALRQKPLQELVGQARAGKHVAAPRRVALLPHHVLERRLACEERERQVLRDVGREDLNHRDGAVAREPARFLQAFRGVRVRRACRLGGQ